MNTFLTFKHASLNFTLLIRELLYGAQHVHVVYDVLQLSKKWFIFIRVTLLVICFVECNISDGNDY